MEKDEVMAKYGSVPLVFTSYYKYSFEFGGQSEDGTFVSCSIGGDANDIYRFQVTPDTTVLLGDLEWNSASITKDGKELWCEHNW